MRLRGKRETSATLRMCLLIECAAKGPTNWVPPKARELLGQETATVHGRTWEASEKKPEGSATEDVWKEQSASCCEVQKGLLKEVLPSWFFHTEQPLSVSKWQRGRGREKAVPGMDMRILDTQAPDAGPCLCSSEQTRAWLWKSPEYVQRTSHLSPALETKERASRRLIRLQWGLAGLGRGLLLLLTPWGGPGGVWTEQWPKENYDL